MPYDGCLVFLCTWQHVGVTWGARPNPASCNHSNSTLMVMVCVDLPLLPPCSGVAPSAATCSSSLNLLKKPQGYAPTHTSIVVSCSSRHSECLSVGMKLTTITCCPLSSFDKDLGKFRYCTCGVGIQFLSSLV